MVLRGDDLTSLIVDIGETLTTAFLIEKVDDRYTVRDFRKTSTTVEPTQRDASIGVVNVIREIEKATSRRLLSRGKVMTPKDKDRAGVDLFLCTSSTGGGLQMCVSGLISDITAESARRTALGAGALLLDVFSIDDERMPYERIEQIRRLKPDILLLAGGTDGGQVDLVVGTAELIARADPKPRFGAEFKLPIIYAGNVDARSGVQKALGNGFAIKMVENIRPTLEVENLGPAREAIYDDFMGHVIIHQPGYDKLAKWTKIPIMPTQAAIGEMIYTIAKHYNQEVIGIDVEEATIDTYSVFKEVFNRSLDADFGMGYGICNILKQAGVERILRWMPFEIEENELRNTIANRMVRVRDAQETARNLLIEQAVAREGMQLALEHHKEIAVGLRGVRPSPFYRIETLFEPKRTGEPLVNMMDLDILIGMGMLTRVRPEQAALMLIDAFQPEGITKLAVDKMGIMSHIGMLQRMDQQAAMEVLEDKGLLRLGTCITPKGVAKEGEKIIHIEAKVSDENVIEKDIAFGELEVIPLENGKLAEVKILPAGKFDVGRGAGKSLTAMVKGGSVGLIIDARGRPISIPKEKRIAKLIEWGKALNAYPEDLRMEQSVKGG